jgi:hypothetical protein
MPWAIAWIAACVWWFARPESISARAAVRMHWVWCLYRCLRSGHGQGWQATRPDSLHHGNALEKHFSRRKWSPTFCGLALSFTPLSWSASWLPLLWSLATRVPLKVDVIRDRSVLLAREADDGRIENVITSRS